MLYLKEEYGTLYDEYFDNRKEINANKLWEHWNKSGGVKYSDLDKWPRGIRESLKKYYIFFENEFSSCIDITPSVSAIVSVFDENNEEVCLYNGLIDQCSALFHAYENKSNKNVTREVYCHRGFSVRIKCFGSIYSAVNVNLIDAFRELKNILNKKYKE